MNDCIYRPWRGAKPELRAAHRWITGYAGKTRQCTHCRKLERIPDPSMSTTNQTYSVRGDHPTLPRPDRFGLSATAALQYADHLRRTGFNNIAVAVEDTAAGTGGDTTPETPTAGQCTLGVGDGNGSLFVHGDYESIKAAQALLDERDTLAAQLAQAQGEVARLRTVHLELENERNHIAAELATVRAECERLRDTMRRAVNKLEVFRQDDAHEILADALPDSNPLATDAKPE